MEYDEQKTRAATAEAEPPAPAGPPRTGRARVVVTAIVALAIVGAIVAAGILPRVKARQALKIETDELAVPSVSVIRLRRSSAGQEIVLPANLQPYIDAPIYARTNGYLRRWDADLGAHVKQGQLLAEIDSPEVDAQLRQARADVGTAQANLNLAAITAARYQNLLKTDSVSKQDTDNAVGDLAAKQAIVRSNESNVKRLEELVSFEKIYAPFDGVITARNTDVGQLIDSGSATSQRELFHVASISTLRVYVQVPQVDSAATRPGLAVDLTLPEFPGRRFTGTLVRTADAIDPASRTLLVEVDVRNPTGELLPGAYAEAHFKLPATARANLLPVSALIFRSAGLQVATVDDGQHAVLKSIQVGRDFGTQVEVLSGVSDEDVVIVNPPDSLVSGDTVHPVPASGEGGE
ncbi:MAG TPA: efflux RND transporter periplasmic adaptor subunit [Terriglobia bacterium]|nr:efflux RND transporter periplasmic adaptor subunit [Terriglobia bacterium]